MHVCPSRLRPYLKGEGINQKSKTWLPPPLVLVLGEANIAMVDAAISAQRCLLSKTQKLAYKLVDLSEPQSSAPYQLGCCSLLKSLFVPFSNSLVSI